MPGTGTKTALFSRTIPGGIRIIVDEKEVTTGNVWWVDSGQTTTGGDTAGHGQNPDKPFLTVDYAIGRCTPNNGDIIVVEAGHTETVTGAGGIALDVAGVTIIGQGIGDNRPTITFTTGAAASMTVSVSDCKIENIIFKCNITSQTHMIDVTGDDLEISYCDFLEGTQTGLCFISADTADGDSDNLYIHHCQFYAPTAGNYAQAIDLGKDFAGVRIEDNAIYGDFDEAGIDVPTGGNACVNLQIHRNKITNLLTGQHAIQISGTAVTGMATNNDLQTDAYATVFDASALSCMRNYWCDSDGSNDEEGIPANIPISAAGNPDAVPAADTTDNVLMRDVVGNKSDAAADGAVTTGESVMAYVKQNVGGIITVDAFHDVPAADTTDNAQVRDVVGNKSDAAADGAVTTTESVMAYAKQNVGALITVDGFHDVPAADTTDNAQVRDVVGNKSDAAADGAVTTTESVMAYAKQLVGGQITIDAFHDVPAADTTDNAQVRDVVGNKSDAAADGAVTTTESVMAYAKQLVGGQITIDAFHDVPAADTTDNAQVRDVVGNKTDAAADGVVTATESAMAYMKQLVTQDKGIARHAITFTAGGDGSVGAHNLFTVTGTVRCRMIAVCTTVTAIQGGATIEVGISGTTDAFIAQTAGDAPDEGEIWHDATPDASIEADTVAAWQILANASDITYTVGSATIDSGVIEFYCEWEKLSSDGNVVAA